jgi:hypothetical protein
MKILMVSMPSLHFFRWTEQLEGSGHDVYWFDIVDGGHKVSRLNFVHQKVGWKRRWNFPGRFFIKTRTPRLYQTLQIINDRETAKEFEKYLLNVQPDVVQSFVMYMTCVPLLEVMKRNSKFKWIYSAWGNDLFYYQNTPNYLKGIKQVMPYLDYMFADCKRDYFIADSNGFCGTFLSNYPGGGGYEFEMYESFLKPYTERKIILIKGYEHIFGRCNKVLEAINILKEKLHSFDIVVFGANDKVLNFVKKNRLNEWKNLMIHKNLSHSDVLKLMGESLIYIGNSISDGMPNTLLEAIVMEAFPIQSNPGGATAELISHRDNGLLIEDPEDVKEIVKHISYALKHLDKLQEGVAYNNKNIKPKLERNYIKKQVLTQYKKVEEDLKKNND